MQYILHRSAALSERTQLSIDAATDTAHSKGELVIQIGGLLRHGIGLSTRGLGHDEFRLLPVAACALVSVSMLGCSNEKPQPMPSTTSSDSQRSPTNYTYIMRADGLGETVRIEKSTSELQVLRQDGRRQRYTAFQQEEAAARRARWGALSPRLYAHVYDNLAEDSDVSISIFVNPAYKDQQLARRLNATNLNVQRAAQAEHREAIANARQSWLARLEPSGMRNLKAAHSMPLIYGVATKRVVRQLGTIDGILLIDFNSFGQASAGSVPRNGISDAHIDSEANTALQIYGEGQRIGLVERSGGAVQEDHVSLSALELDTDGPLVSGYNITYQTEPIACIVDSDCPAFSSPQPQYCRTLPGHPTDVCVDQHASEVLSVMSGTTSLGDEPWGVGASRIFYANRVDGTQLDGDSRCSVDGIADIYDFFDQYEVKTTNESFSCALYDSSRGGLGGQLDGMVQDYHARMNDVSIFKIAGNAVSGNLDAACPYTLNSNCVGGINSNGNISCFSLWNNWNGIVSDRLDDPFRTDREEPDIVALAGDSPTCGGITSGVDVMNIYNDTSWTTDIGTSFAAPAMTALGALVKQACSPSGQMNEKLLRAILRNAGWARNIQDFSYSTPSTDIVSGGDWKDGGGALYASAALAYCGVPQGSGGPQVVSGINPGDLSEGGPPPSSSGPCENCDDNYSPIQDGDGGVRPLHATVPGSVGDSRMYNKLWEGDFVAGDRVRATIAWDNCPTIGQVAPAPVATDLDLILYNSDRGTYVYSSQVRDGQC